MGLSHRSVCRSMNLDTMNETNKLSNVSIHYTCVIVLHNPQASVRTVWIQSVLYWLYTNLHVHLHLHMHSDRRSSAAPIDVHLYVYSSLWCISVPFCSSLRTWWRHLWQRVDLKRNPVTVQSLPLSSALVIAGSVPNNQQANTGSAHEVQRYQII